ncbi:hypothetical protein SOPP22_08940 [Shewanella sp. OPT22]|nr:hypothetical protein SOPP22_08940 [Shewanella sp. OPT22]
MAAATIATSKKLEHRFELQVPVCKAAIKQSLKVDGEFDTKQFKLKFKRDEVCDLPSFHLNVTVFPVIDRKYTFGIKTEVDVDVEHQHQFRQIQIKKEHLGKILLSFFEDLNACFDTRSTWFIVQLPGSKCKSFEAYSKPNISSFSYNMVLKELEPAVIEPEQPPALFSQPETENGKIQIELTLSKTWQQLISKDWKVALSNCKFAAQSKYKIYLCLLALKHINPDYEAKSLDVLHSNDFSVTNINIHLKDGSILKLSLKLGDDSIAINMPSENTVITVVHNLVNITGTGAEEVKSRVQKAYKFEDELEKDRKQRSGRDHRTPTELKMEKLLEGCELVERSKSLFSNTNTRENYVREETTSKRSEVFQGSRGLS